jgi:hypothetical protein
MLAAGLRAFWLRAAGAARARNCNEAVAPGQAAPARSYGRASARRPSALCVVLVCVMVLGVDAAGAQDGRRLAEQDIKAGLLYNFLRYTDWPATAQRAVTIDVCLYGGDPFEGRLAPMAGRTVNQRVIAIRTVRTSAELGACALVFVNARERSAWPRLRAELSRRSVLTVSDYEGFARAGGMLEFTRVRNRVGVAVNVEAASAANLRVQDRLLRLAAIVSSEGR